MITIRDLDPETSGERFAIEAPIEGASDLTVAVAAEQLLKLGTGLMKGRVHVDLCECIWRHGSHLTTLLARRWLSTPALDVAGSTFYVAGLCEVPTRQLCEVRDLILARAQGAAIAKLEDGDAALDPKMLSELLLGAALPLEAELGRRLEAAGTLSNPSDVQ
jgi:hypothetical protein